MSLNISDKIKEIRSLNDLTQQEFANKIGESKAQVAHWETSRNYPKLENLIKISETFGVSSDWLLDLNKDSLIRAPEGRFKRRIKAQEELKDANKIAFYDADFEAGKGVAFYEDIRSSEPAYYMDVPDFAGCTAFRTYGKSMQPQIEPGAILFGTKEEDWREYIEYGQIYGIVMKDQKRLLKQVKKSKKGEDYFLLLSANPEFDEFDIPKSKIKSIWLIHGWLNKNT